MLFCIRSTTRPSAERRAWTAARLRADVPTSPRDPSACSRESGETFCPR